jgi:hypothetical protein
MCLAFLRNKHYDNFTKVTLLLLLAAAAAAAAAAVNLRWWLDKADMRDLRLYTINGLLLLLVWGVARVVLFVPFYVHVLANWVSAVAGHKRCVALAKLQDRMAASSVPMPTHAP